MLALKFFNPHKRENSGAALLEIPKQDRVNSGATLLGNQKQSPPPIEENLPVKPDIQTGLVVEVPTHMTTSLSLD